MKLLQHFRCCSAPHCSLPRDRPADAAVPGAAAGPAAAIDFSGMWTGNMQEDNMERGAGPELVDYAGFPINEAGGCGRCPTIPRV